MIGVGYNILRSDILNNNDGGIVNNPLILINYQNRTIPNTNITYPDTL